MDNQEIIAQLTAIINNGGPDFGEYAAVDYLIGQLEERITNSDFPESDLISLLQQCAFLHDVESIMGHIRLKPYGYAGDFSIIERIYTNATSARHHKWDLYALANTAAVAVRNRKEYFKSVTAQRLQSGGKLLNIASGPARDLFEFYQEYPSSEVQTTCVEMDAQAVAYAKGLNAGHLERIQFINRNIFQFRTKEHFDVIWSAGLFDYFNDDAFVVLLKRFKKWLAAAGEIIIGNFNEANNPSRAFMERFGEWHLNHRAAEKLVYLAESAGFDKACIHVDQEPENVNLFLHIKSR